MSSISVLRTENKYILTPIAAAAIKRDLSALLRPDSFSVNGSYRVKSLYFDSVTQHDYLAKKDGVGNRRKIRLRIYDEENSVIKLEEKVKHGVYQGKTSISLTRDDALKLVCGDCSVLQANESALIQDIYLKMILGVYRPAVIVEYDRYAFAFPEFNTRITLDSDVKSSELDLRLFSKNNNWTFRMNDLVILEVKYNGYLLKEISAIVGKYALSQTAVSKYVLGRPIFEEYIYR